MRSFNTKLFGIDAYVEYTYTPAERETTDYPGCDADIEIEGVILSKYESRIAIDGRELNDETYNDLRRQAFEDVES